MFSFNDISSQMTGLTIASVIPFLVALGIGLILFGIHTAFLTHDPVAARMKKTGNPHSKKAKGAGLLKSANRKPEGLLKALVPEDHAERKQIHQQLAQAGFGADDAVKKFFLMRLTLAMIVPFLSMVVLSVRTFTNIPAPLDDFLNGFSNLQVLQMIAVSAALGFYGPGMWLKSRIKQRQQRIEEAFPNALDLLQISVEAGMGFDTAVARVSLELRRVSPEIAIEFDQLQSEVLAGRDREKAMSDMADRMGIDEARSFVNVIGQSIQYGTSISDAMTAYAIEMRDNRELRAQEKANKLPVQMSAVMASMMLPALFILTLGPIVIRYVRMFAEG